MRLKTKIGMVLLVQMILIIMAMGCTLKEKQQVYEYKGSHDHDQQSHRGYSIPTPEILTEKAALKTPEITPKKKLGNITKPKINVRGIYVSGWVAGGRKIGKLTQLVDETSLNAMVIDLKNDRGQVTYDSHVPLVNEIGSDRYKAIPDIEKLVLQLKQKHIYLIGRVVVFKDPYLAMKKNAWAMQRKSGGLWKDTKGVAWVDPYNSKVWSYNIAIAKEASELGFDEIQFDYIRFPENGAKVDREILVRNPNQWSKAQVVHYFLKEAKKNLKPTGSFISADVFGLTTSVQDDMGIGQRWELISTDVDYISPMVYPSHYSKGAYGIKNPDLDPYGIIKTAMRDANKKQNQLKQIQTSRVSIIRPWFQDFTATWVHPHKTYGYAEVMSQINAAKEQGVEQYLLWNPHCEYSIK